MKRALLLLLWLGCTAALPAREVNLVQNPDFESVDPGSQTPAGYQLAGTAAWGRLGGDEEMTTHGVVMPGDATSATGVSQMVRIDRPRDAGCSSVFAAWPRTAFPWQTIRCG